MKQWLTTPLGQFRIVSFAEGVSYILLVFLAMPLKYMAGEPLMVRIFGSIHGFLVILFVLMMLHAARSCGWRLPRVLFALGSSLVPFGAFVLERSLKKEQEALALKVEESA